MFLKSVSWDVEAVVDVSVLVFLSFLVEPATASDEVITNTVSNNSHE